MDFEVHRVVSHSKGVRVRGRYGRHDEVLLAHERRSVGVLGLGERTLVESGTPVLPLGLWAFRRGRSPESRTTLPVSTSVTDTTTRLPFPPPVRTSPRRVVGWGRPSLSLPRRVPVRSVSV